MERNYLKEHVARTGRMASIGKNRFRQDFRRNFYSEVDEALELVA